MNRRERRLAARKKVMACSDAAKHPRLPLDGLVAAMEELEFAAQALVDAVDESPERERPAGWGRGPGAESA